MEQTIINIGNSKGIIIPQKMLGATGLKTGDKVIVKADKNKISVTPIKTPMGGVDENFMKMVDEFAEEHKDVLQQLSNR